MGEFLVEVQGEGNHGCQREIKDGGHVVGCEKSNCPDCITREFVRRLKRAGVTLRLSSLTHWPGTDHQVVDNLLSGARTGSF